LVQHGRLLVAYCEGVGRRGAEPPDRALRPRLVVRILFAAELDAVIAEVFGVDSQLIADDSYFVIEAGGAMLACGRWR
jgi:hypothetical protein